MRADVIDIHLPKVGNPRFKELDKGIREAVADHLRHRWPHHTAKSAAREYDLSLDRAKEAVAGRASLPTIERIFKRGGWFVALAILADVIGHSVAQHIARLREAHNEHGERLTALFGDPGAASAVRPGGHSSGSGVAADDDEPARRGVGLR
jgi:hypothetical protein